MTILVHFAPGKHYGYQFDADGNVTAVKPYTLSRNSGASADQRGPIPNRSGIWLHIFNGVWAGYWVHESSIAAVNAVPEAQIPDVVVGPPPPPKPWSQYGAIFKKDFSDGTLAPFKVQTFFDDHIGQPGQWMTSFCRFTNGAKQVSVHDGYADLRATKRPDGLYDAVLLCSSIAWDKGPTFGYGVVRWWARMNIGPGTFQALWSYETTTWTAPEIDFPEILEGQQLTAHLLGHGLAKGADGLYGLPKPADLATTFHEFKIERRATFSAFSIDGVEVGRLTAPAGKTFPAIPLALMADTCVGHGWVGPSGGITSQTPNPVFLHIAAVCVDA